MSTEYTPARATDDESTSMVGAARDSYQASRAAMELEDGRSIGQILGDLSRHVSTLMRQEVALAKAELGNQDRGPVRARPVCGGGRRRDPVPGVPLRQCLVGLGESSADWSA